MLRSVLWHRELTPALAGRRIAREVGCLACHQAPSQAPIQNPGSRWGSVPRFGGGNAMMYVETAADVEELVRTGALTRWRESPSRRQSLEEQRVRMPAYEESLSAAEIDAVVAWVAAVEEVEAPGDETAAAGRRLARDLGCIACHGPEGIGGEPSPGSLGGFVPGFAGRNFTHLVRDREEFAEWVRTGRSERLAGNPVVRWFWDRQLVSMPAYGDDLTDRELDQLWAWIGAVRRTDSP